MKKNKVSVASIKNHPNHPNPSAFLEYFYTDFNEKVVAYMDPVFEVLYWVPLERPNTHEVFSKSCLEDNIPYIDGSSEFQIAVPIDYYIEGAKKAGTMDHYNSMIEIEKIIMNKWNKFKESNFSEMKAIS